MKKNKNKAHWNLVKLFWSTVCVYMVYYVLYGLNYKLNKLTFNYLFFYFTIRALKFPQGLDS